MEDDYESARKLLEDLRKKYSTKNTNEEKNKNEKNICDQPTTSKASLQDLQKKYLSKNVVEESDISETRDKPKSSKGQPQKKKQDKPKEKGTTVKLPTSNSSSSNSKYDIVTTIIDTAISNKYGADIIEKLQQLQMFYKFTDQICPGLITWSRSSSKEDIDRQEDTKEVVIIMYWEDIVSYIKSSSLLSHIKSLQEVLPGKKVFLGLYGIAPYFSYWKAQRGGNMSKADEKRLSQYKNSIKISREDFEMALTEVQLSCNCCYRLLNSSQDIVDLIQQFTKSITQMPEKLEKREKYKDYEWHMLKDNRDCVPVDKNGNGLQRLWQQQLTSFELARLETAEAIIAQYSTPAKLYEAYKDTTAIEGQKLLEDILIRRSAGPLTSFRKVGPELSNKVYNFFNSVNGDVVL